MLRNKEMFKEMGMGLMTQTYKENVLKFSDDVLRHFVA